MSKFALLLVGVVMSSMNSSAKSIELATENIIDASDVVYAYVTNRNGVSELNLKLSAPGVEKLKNLSDDEWLNLVVDGKLASTTKIDYSIDDQLIIAPINGNHGKRVVEIVENYDVF